MAGCGRDQQDTLGGARQALAGDATLVPKCGGLEALADGVAKGCGAPAQLLSLMQHLGALLGLYGQVVDGKEDAGWDVSLGSERGRLSRPDRQGPHMWQRGLLRTPY